MDKLSRTFINALAIYGTLFAVAILWSVIRGYFAAYSLLPDLTIILMIIWGWVPSVVYLLYKGVSFLFSLEKETKCGWKD